MHCYYHAERKSVATCQVCGKGLCAECASVFNPPTCHACILEHVNGEKTKMVKSIVTGVILGTLCCIILKNPMGLLFAGVPFGWMALSAITPNIFLFMPVVGWLIYFAIKFLIAYLIGWIALPIKIYKWIRFFSTAKKTL